MTCDQLVAEWKILPEVAAKFLVTRALFQQRTGRDLTIFSGHRTCERQKELERAGNPTASAPGRDTCDVSNHVICPGRAVDVCPEGFPARAIKAELGRAAIEAGFRWGGGSPVDEAGIPSDWRHLDLGPRQ